MIAPFVGTSAAAHPPTLLLKGMAPCLSSGIVPSASDMHKSLRPISHAGCEDEVQFPFQYGRCLLGCTQPWNKPCEREMVSIMLAIYHADTSYQGMLQVADTLSWRV